jgi:hypothetical protein
LEAGLLLKGVGEADASTYEGRFGFWQKQLKLTHEALKKAPCFRS